MNAEHAIDVFRRAEPELRARYGVIEARLFGSVARGANDGDSDVDVAVQFQGGAPTDVMTLCGVSGLLSELFDADVDVVALPTRDPGLSAAIDLEAVIAF